MRLSRVLIVGYAALVVPACAGGSGADPDDGHVPGAGDAGPPEDVAPNHDAPTGACSATRCLSAIAEPGADLVIPPGEEVVIDGNFDLGVLRVEGRLSCPPSGSHVLRSTGIVVSGELTCGTADDPFEGQLEIALEPGALLPEGGERSFVVTPTGVLSLHGDPSRAGHVKLAAHAEAGDTALSLERPVSWRPGDPLVVTPTSFEPHEAETVFVDRAEGSTVHLTTPLRYPHFGELQTIPAPSRSWTLDERAVVADLRRNIRVHATGDPATHDFLGGHTMILRGGRAYIDSVEFTAMGRMGEIARYPVHWHLAGDVPGQYVIRSSIHHTYQRCITIHGTNQLLVENNVCYDHYGHGFFLEDGNEVGNRIVGNLGVLSRRVPAERALLASDVDGNPLRFAAPSTYWIAHPDNYVVGNIAAGSEGTGFWNAFSSGLRCDGGGCVTDLDNPTVRPRLEDTWAFQDNVAHSSLIGITWDGAPDGALRGNPNNPRDRDLIAAHYAPSTLPVYRGLVAFKNVNTGVYFRGETAEFVDNRYTNNGWNLFFAYNQVVRDSLVVGKSANFFSRDYAALRSQGKLQRQKGVVLYDGPFDLDEVDFLGYPVMPLAFDGVDVTPIPVGAIGGANRFTNVVRRLAFLPEPPLKYDLGGNLNWVDSPWSMSLRDLDGSLSGRPGTLLVPAHDFNMHPSCTAAPASHALLCDYRVGVLTFRGTDQSHVPFAAIRSDGPRTVTTAEDVVGSLHNKVHFIQGDAYDYALEFPATYARPANLTLLYQTEALGDLSPVVRLQGLGTNCRLGAGTPYTSVAELRQADATGFVSTARDLWVRLETTVLLPTSTNAARARSALIPLLCD